MCLIVVSVCTIVNLRHWVSLAPLFGSVYITVLNCVCYVMFIWWFVLYSLCTVLRGRYCVIQRSCCNTNNNIPRHIIGVPGYWILVIEWGEELIDPQDILNFDLFYRVSLSQSCDIPTHVMAPARRRRAVHGRSSDIGMRDGAATPDRWPTAVNYDDVRDCTLDHWKTLHKRLIAPDGNYCFVSCVVAFPPRKVIIAPSSGGGSLVQLCMPGKMTRSLAIADKPPYACAHRRCCAVKWLWFI